MAIITKSREAFVGSITAYLAGLGWRLLFQGTGAAINLNGKVVILPAALLTLWDRGKKLNRSERDSLLLKARCFGLHECLGHGRNTDPCCVKPTNKATFRIYNTIEDARIESVVSREYKGAFMDLCEGIRHLADEGAFDWGLEDPAEALAGYICCYGRTAIGQDVADKRDRLAPAIRSMLGDKAFATLNGMLDTIPTLPDTKASVKLAEEIVKLLQDAPNQMQQNDGQEDKNDDQQQGSQRANPGNGGGGNASDQQDGQSDQPPSPSPTDNQPGQSPSGQNGEDKEDAADGQSSGKGHNQENSPGGEPSDNSAPTNEPGDPQALQEALEGLENGKGANAPDFGQTLARELTDKLGANAVTNAAQDPSLRIGEETDLAGGKMGGHGIGRDYRGSLKNVEEIARATNRLRAKMAGLVQAERLKTSPPMSSGHRLDRRRCTRLPMGDVKIFQRRFETPETNTAVKVLVDGSGSMGENGAQLACSAAHVIAESLFGMTGTACSIDTFPWGTNGVGTILNWGKKPLPERGYAYSGGGTPTAEAVNAATINLNMRSEDRKILVVITDGEPNNHVAAQNAIQRAEATGIEVFGIGIGAVQGFASLFKRNRTEIRSIPELPEALVKVMTAALTKRR